MSAIEQKKQIESLSLKIAVKCGANGKVFGSVSNKEVSDELAKYKIDVDRKKIEFNNIKTTGFFDVKVKLFPGVTAILKIEVVGQ